MLIYLIMKSNRKNKFISIIEYNKILQLYQHHL